MRLKFIFFAILLLLASSGYSADWNGGVDLGFWYIRNNLSDNPLLLQNDGIGETYIDDSYRLFILNARGVGLGVFSKNTNFHFDMRSLLNPFDDRYTFGVAQNRFDVRQLAIETRNDNFDLWWGRQRILEAGNVGLDGVRTVIHTSPTMDVGVYGGLGSNPRNYTGYIGPYYEKNPINLKLQAFGAYLSHRQDHFSIDAALNTLFFKFKPDRLFFFTQAMYKINPVWSLSGVMQASFNDYKGFETLQASVITRPSKKWNNTLSFYRFVTLSYKESRASAIPVGPVIDPDIIGGVLLNTTSYYSVRDHIMVHVMNSNYIFAAIEYSKRTFDDLSRMKYTAGFRDPELFNSSWDLRVQTDLIQNYRGFNSMVDFLVGKEFLSGKTRLDFGATLFSNERDIYVDYVNSGLTRQSDEEYRLRILGTWLQTQKLMWNASYAYNHEVDATNNNQDVNFHEFFLMTNVRF